jgi:DNA-binding beta-propeller fold protein YncE
MRPVLRFLRAFAALAALAMLGSSAPPSAAAPPSYVLFESGPVRPVALSPSGHTLFVCNIPDNRLEIFRVTGRGLDHRGSVPVGLEPVAVAARSDKEAWVVNHLSDSVSVVQLRNGHDPRPGRHPVGRVVRTLWVGDEPRDIVFAGGRAERAFVTTAHRGQNAPYDPQLTTPGVGRADVWVFDADCPDAPPTILTLFCDTPRALAASPDGRLVYAAGFLSGNRTTAVFEQVVTAAGGPPGPSTNYAGVAQPPTSLIVKRRPYADPTAPGHDAQEHWLDELDRNWDAKVRFSLPDKDVFVIDAAANPPALVPGDAGFFAGVGTTLFNMAVNPRTGRVYVSNTEARNHVRFEGAGTFLKTLDPDRRTVRGHIAESRITVLGGAPRVNPVHLNKHVNFGSCCAPISSAENSLSVAFPLAMEVTRDGSTLYAACFGTGEVAVYDTAELESNTFTPDLSRQIPVSGGGPCGLALDERRERLYVLTRFDNAVSIVDTRAREEVGRVPLFNPEPESVRAGRPFLYDASLTSSHGDTACASCHVFGDFDGLAWDLGDPDGDEIANNGVFTVPPEPFLVTRHHRPMKGPMATQSLRGLDNHGAMHWRGDRRGEGASVQPDGGAFDERAAFRAFNVAFRGLNGRDESLTPAQMEAFVDFALQIAYPPNPIRALDDSLTPSQQAGRDLYFNPARRTDTFFTCNGCHVLDPGGNAAFGVPRPGFFGTDGRFSFEGEPQVFKIPHLRNMYQKVGMFGMTKAPFFLPENPDPAQDNPFTGDQVRGFGFFHDGSVDTLFRFHSTILFLQRPPGTISPRDPGNPEGIPLTPQGFQERKNLEAFMLAFDSNLKPIVGQQATLHAQNGAALAARLALMEAQAEAVDPATGLTHCDLVARSGGRGYLYRGGGLWRPDRAGEPPLPGAALRALARRPQGEVTFTCVPPGSGVRIGLDRDGDGVFDGDE